MAVLISPQTAMTISTEEREFFVALGARIAELRRSCHMTQAQLGDALAISQQTIQAYEAGRRRIPISALPTVARLLAVSLEELFATVDETGSGRSRRSRGCPRPNSAL